MRARLRPRGEAAGAVMAGPSERGCIRQDWCYIAGLAPIPNRFSEPFYARTLLLALALLTAFGGCSHPRRPGLVAAYAPGQKLTSKKVPYDATVELYARDRPDAVGPLTSTGVTGGTRLGFRREADGTIVAFVGERPVAIPDGQCEWVIVASSWPRWWSRRADDAERAAQAAGQVLVLTGIGLGILGFTAAYTLAGGST